MQRDELLYQFNKDHEMQYLRHQVRHMENPDLDQEQKVPDSPKRDSSNQRDYPAYNMDRQNLKHLQGINVAKMLPESSMIDPRTFPSQ